MRALVLAVVLAGCGATAQAPARDLDWMGGYWLACDRGETAETWVGAGRGVLVGTNLSGSGFEFLRIAPNEAGAIVYFAMPGGRAPPTEFPLVSNADQRAVFENPAHDFPQRVIYERDGETMVARIEGMIDGAEQGMEWRFTRAELDARCPGS
jgi:hypothetical protein